MLLFMGLSFGGVLFLVIVFACERAQQVTAAAMANIASHVRFWLFTAAGIFAAIMIAEAILAVPAVFPAFLIAADPAEHRRADGHRILLSVTVVSQPCFSAI